MTRKRVGGGLLESFSEPCECCNGRGIHVTLSPVEPKPDKSGGPSRRRKRKGEIEKAVEDKIVAERAQPGRHGRRAASSADEPTTPVAENGHRHAHARRAEHAEARTSAERPTTASRPTASLRVRHGRRRRSRRSPRAKSEAAAD